MLNLVLLTQSGKLAHRKSKMPRGVWEYCSLGTDTCMGVCLCVCLISFLYSFPIHSRKVQVTGAELQCHPADIFPGRHHRTIPHRPVASRLPWTLSFLYERQSHTGTYYSGNKNSTILAIDLNRSQPYHTIHDNRVAKWEEAEVFPHFVFPFQNCFKQ